MEALAPLVGEQLGLERARMRSRTRTAPTGSLSATERWRCRRSSRSERRTASRPGSRASSTRRARLRDRQGHQFARQRVRDRLLLRGPIRLRKPHFPGARSLEAARFSTREASSRLEPAGRGLHLNRPDDDDMSGVDAPPGLGRRALRPGQGPCPAGGLSPRRHPVRAGARDRPSDLSQGNEQLTTARCGQVPDEAMCFTTWVAREPQ
jgi:hypothetical protein